MSVLPASVKMHRVDVWYPWRLAEEVSELGKVVNWDHTLSSVRAVNALKDVRMYKVHLAPHCHSNFCGDSHLL